MKKENNTSMKKLSPDLKVVKTNELVNSYYRLGSMEQKILLCACSKIKSDDVSFKVFEISVKEFISLIGGSDGGNCYKNIRKACKKLATRHVEIDTDKEGFIITPWVHQIEFRDDDDSKILLQFNSELSKYLLYVKNNIYTKYKLGTVLQFKSKYSIRIYELMYQYFPKIKERTLTLNKLRKLLGVADDELKLYSHFKKVVLEQSKRELNEKSDIEIEYFEVKKGRKVVSICFNISENFKFTLPLNNWDEYQRHKGMSIDDLSEIFCDILKEKYNVDVPVDVVSEYAHSALLSTIFELKEGYYKNYDIQKPTRYFLTVLENKSNK